MKTENKIIVAVSMLIIIATFCIKVWLQSDKIELLKGEIAIQKSIIQFGKESAAEKDRVIKCFLNAKNISSLEQCHQLDFERNKSEYQKCIDSGEINCSQWNNFNL